MEECPICFERLTKTVKCGFCDYVVCMDCAKRVVVEQRQPHCVECKMVWTNAFLHTVFLKSWLISTKGDGYREARKKLALEVEKAKIPHTFETLVAPQLEIHAKKCEIAGHRRRLAECQKEYWHLMEQSYALEEDMAPFASSDYRKGITALRRRAKESLSEIKKLETMISDRRMEQDDLGGASAKLIGKCPLSDCRGMVDTHGRCLTCQARICTRCLVKKEEKHKCDPDTVATVKAIREDSKPCPSCGTQISKISGCDQMWCTQCKTAFSWNRLVVEHGNIHNPHALQWRREMGLAERNPGDVPCGGFQLFQIQKMHLEAANKAFERFCKLKSMKKSLLKFKTLLDVLYELDAMIENAEHRAGEKLDKVRVDYCLGSITEKKWKDTIFLITREAERKDATRRILMSLRESAVERVLVFADKSSSTSALEEAAYELLQLLSLASDTLEKELKLLGATKGRLWEMKLDGNSTSFIFPKMTAGMKTRQRQRRQAFATPYRPVQHPRNVTFDIESEEELSDEESDDDDPLYV